MDDGPFHPVPAAWPAPYALGLTSQWISPILTSMPIALAVIDSSGRIVAGNEAMVATAGLHWRPGMRPQELVVEADAPFVAQAVNDLVREARGTVVRATLADRPMEPQDISLIPTPPELGVSAIMAMRDIREQLRLERQVAAATRMQAVGQLAGGVAHDFNNLLTAILALTDQLLETEPTETAAHEALRQIRVNGQRGAALVGQLLAFARQQPQRQQLLDVAELVAGLQPLLAQLLGPAVTLDINGTPPGVVRADAGQLEQVLINLAVNARDAMAGNGRLSINLFQVAGRNVPALGHVIMPAIDHVAIEVTDTGAGIPPEIAGRIFEPFFTTKPLGQGTGLGLSTVYGIIKQTGGFIFTRQGPGGIGTSFTVFLPARPRPADLAGRVPARPQSSAGRDLSGVRVLLVEDEPAVREVFARGLTRRGLNVSTAGDAMAGLALLKDVGGFDVLVSDVMMPGIDGVELALQARQLRPDLAVIMMSGYAELPLHRAADAQALRFLAKPFALSDLLSAIAEVLQKAP